MEDQKPDAVDVVPEVAAPPAEPGTADGPGAAASLSPTTSPGPSPTTSPGSSPTTSPGPGPVVSPAISPEVSPAWARFTSCRWHHAAEGEIPAHCTHRDVLPLAGLHGFNPESWCPGCPYYKLRRIVRRPQAY